MDTASTEGSESMAAAGEGTESGGRGEAAGEAAAAAVEGNDAGASGSGGAMRRIAFVIAMEAEAMAFVEHLGLEEHSDGFSAESAGKIPCRLFSGEHHGCEVYVVTPGKCARYGVDLVGTVPAALATYFTVEHCTPDLLINAGTAGGFQRAGGEVGDVYLSARFRYHDRRIGIPGFTEYGVGDYAAQETPRLVEHLQCKTGVTTTGNSLETCDTDNEQMLKNEGVVKDMEAAGIAWVAERFDVPMIAVKVVTDIVDTPHPTAEEFTRNLQTAAQTLQQTLPRVIEFCAGKSLSEL